MEILTIQVNAIETNCYIVTNKNESLIIDPGGNSEKIIKEIEDNSLKPKLCLLTHAHFDHVLAVVEILEKYKIPLLLSKEDLFLLKESIEIDKVEKYIKFIDKDSIISLGELQFQVIETPGHTPGGLCLYSEGESTLIGGDLIFDGGLVGRTDFRYSDFNVMQASLAKVVNLPAETKVYSGHGPSFFLGKWKQ